MSRRCDRPGCSAVGALRYRMVPEDLVFWMAPIDGEPDATEGVLCQRHADRLTVPAGWVVDDRRDPTLRLFRPRRDHGDDLDTTSPLPGNSQRQRSRRSARPSGAQQGSLPFSEDPELDSNTSHDAGHDDGMTSAPAHSGESGDSEGAPGSSVDGPHDGAQALSDRSRRQPGSLLRRAWGIEDA